MLTDTKLKSMKPQDRLYKVSDRDGLYVAVTKTERFHSDMIIALMAAVKR